MKFVVYPEWQPTILKPLKILWIYKKYSGYICTDTYILLLYAIVHFVVTIFSEDCAGIAEFSSDKQKGTNAFLKGYAQVFIDGIVESSTIQTKTYSYRYAISKATKWSYYQIFGLISHFKMEYVKAKSHQKNRVAEPKWYLSSNERINV